jgi:hypothetical protein
MTNKCVTASYMQYHNFIYAISQVTNQRHIFIYKVAKVTNQRHSFIYKLIFYGGGNEVINKLLHPTKFKVMYN